MSEDSHKLTCEEFQSQIAEPTRFRRGHRQPSAREGLCDL